MKLQISFLDEGMDSLKEIYFESLKYWKKTTKIGILYIPQLSGIIESWNG